MFEAYREGKEAWITSSLLIMGDDLLDDDTDTTLCIAPAFPTAEQPPLGGSDPGPGPSPGTNLPLCKCGICQVKPQEIENKCCGKKGMCH